MSKRIRMTIHSQFREPNVTALIKNELHSNDECRLSRCDTLTILLWEHELNKLVKFMSLFHFSCRSQQSMLIADDEKGREYI